MGAYFTAKLEGMFNDMTVSKETSDKFKQTESGKLPFDMEVMVLNHTHWPLNEGDSISLTPELSKAVEKFDMYYKANSDSRLLKWVHGSGVCHVQANYDKKKKHELVVSTIQVCITFLLALFCSLLIFCLPVYLLGLHFNDVQQ